MIYKKQNIQQQSEQKFRRNEKLLPEILKCVVYAICQL
jgi:hypothetical protein